jgi:hypothetical protein
MSWWKKLLGASGAPRASELRFPLVIELIPDALSASVHCHTISTGRAEVPCWSYVSKGLVAVEHEEVVITLRREADEPESAFPDDALRLFRLFHQLARQGQRVTPGQFSELGGKRFFGHHLVYARAQSLGGVVLPPSCLAAVQVNDDELGAVRAFGASRVLARMGEAARYYPFPPWNERRRSTVSIAAASEPSLLAQVPRYRASLGVVMSDKRVTVIAARSAQPQLRAMFAKQRGDNAFAVLTELDATADSCLVWRPGQQEPCAIAAPGSHGDRTSGCYVAFLLGRPEDGALLIEDGFVVDVTSVSWAALLRAVDDGTDVAIATTGAGMSFALAWMDETYVSPIDGATYRAEAGWRNYLPTGDAASRRSAAPGDNIHLLTDLASIEARCSVSDLTTFCEEVLRCMERALARSNSPAKVVVRMTCTPAGHRVDLARQGTAPPEVLQEMRDALVALASLPVREREIVFEVRLTATGSA